MPKDYNKAEIVSKASSAIKPGLWYVGSSTDEAGEGVTKSEAKKLKKLTKKTQTLQARTSETNYEISKILDRAIERNRKKHKLGSMS